MTDLLVDVGAFLSDTVRAAAIRQAVQQYKISRYALVASTDYLHAWLHLHQQPETVVLSSNERTSDLEGAKSQGDDLLVWCSRFMGIPKDKIRPLIKGQKKSKWSMQFDYAKLQYTNIIENEPDEDMTPLCWISVTPDDDTPIAPDTDYRLVTEATYTDDLWELVQHNGMTALDFETSDPGAYPGGYPYQTNYGFSYSIRAGMARYVPLVGEYAIDQAKALLTVITNGPWVAHNAKYEWHCLLNIGITPEQQPEDTMVLAWHEGKEKSLKKLALSELGIRMTTFEEVSKGKDFSTVPIDEAVRYGCADSDMTLRLWQQDTGYSKSYELYTVVDRPLIPVLAAMERRGVMVDTGWLQQWERELTDKINLLDTVIRNEAWGYVPANEPTWNSIWMREVPMGQMLNPNSSADIGWLLFHQLGLEPHKSNSKGYSTDESSLLKIRDQHGVVQHLLDYRGLAKMRSTYAVGLRTGALRHGDGILRASFDGTGTRTGRLSSKQPNAQNIPGVARTAIRSRMERVFVAADYSQIELRVLAHVSGDPRMTEAFQAGISPHMVTLKEVFGYSDKHENPKAYTLSKNINFGIPYGAGPEKLIEVAREGGIDLSLSEAREFYAGHRHIYPVLWEWIEACKRQAARDGYTDTLQGHRAWYPDLASADPGLRAAAERECVNHVIQGSAGYFTKQAMVDWLWSEIAPMVLQVHDEIVVECADYHADSVLAQLKHVMIGAAQLSIPVEVEGAIGTNWASLK